MATDPHPAIASAEESRRLLKADRGWLPGIEVLRGVAASMVVVHHTWSLSTMPRFPGYQIVEGFGSLGVNLFFLLSGFLLANGFWVPRGNRHYRSYFVRRIFRIAPTYYIAVGFLFLFFADHALVFSAQGARQILANATFTQFLFPNTSSSLNVDGALWTLTAEFMLYLLLPLMALPFLRVPRIAFASLVGIGLAWRLVVALDGDWLRSVYFADGGPGLDVQSLFLVRQFIGILPIFAIGIGLKWLTVQRKLDPIRAYLPQRMSMRAILATLVPPVAFLFWVERGSNYHHWVWFTGYDFVMTLLLAPVVVVASQPGWFPITVLSRAATWIGDRSYSLYVWHFPIILSVLGRGPLIAPPDTSHIWLRVALIWTLAVLAAHISFVAFEKPGIRLGRRLAARFQ